jgi:hypothetical protein
MVYQCVEFNLEIYMHVLRVLSTAFILMSAPVLAHADDWGAIAIDTEKAEKSPYYGIGGGDSEKEAVDNAMKFCVEAGGKVCKAIVSYQQCGALAVSGKGDAGWGKAPTKRTAEAQAIAGCQNDACKVAVADCN